jgi:hypothetical protein
MLKEEADSAVSQSAETPRVFLFQIRVRASADNNTRSMERKPRARASRIRGVLCPVCDRVEPRSCFRFNDLGEESVLKRDRLP